MGPTRWAASEYTTSVGDALPPCGGIHAREWTHQLPYLMVTFPTIPASLCPGTEQ